MFDLSYLQYLLSSSGESASLRTVETCLSELASFAIREQQFSPALEAVSALEMLGHCEVAGLGPRARISIAQPALAILPTAGPFEAVLTGKRTPSTLEELRNTGRELQAKVTVNMTTTSISGGWASAARIVVQSPTLDQVEALGKTIGISVSKQPACWEILSASPSVSSILSTAYWQEGNLIPVEATYFSSDSLRFNSSYSGGLQLARWHDSNGAVRYALKKDRQVAFLNGPEWGRHIQLAACGISCLRYDFSRRTMGHRATVRFPKLIIRSLVLCSGRLPRLTRQRSERGEELYLLYDHVPLHIAQLAGERLGQDLIPSNWSNNESE